MLRILLIDGMAILYRAFYSSRVDFNSHGEAINALRKYLYLIDSFNKEYPCDEIVICEDAPRDTLYRKQLFTGYKQGRKPPPKELTQQKGILFGFMRKIGFPVIGLQGYEADDVIGTMSKNLSEDGHYVLIASPDKDMYQLLINDKIAMIQHNSNTRTQVLLYRDDIYSMNGYWPEQVIDLKILSGDNSDNIPGVPRCGYRNSIKILQKYGSIENMMSANVTDPLDIQVKEYILNHIDEIEMFRSIIKIDCNVDQAEISKQLAFNVDNKIMADTMNRYEVISGDDFSQLSFCEYIYRKLLNTTQIA